MCANCIVYATLRIDKKLNRYKMKKVIIGKSKGLEDAEQCDIHFVSKRLLGNHLADEIKKCSKEMKRLKAGSVEWTWFASKKSTAESILIKFT
jgi:hypothetical protein